MTNTSAPVWQEVKVVGVRKNAGPDNKDVVTESVGHEFVPQTPEAFTYDDDGNLTADGRWAYTWDGENRLVTIEAASGLPAGARKKIEFAYDGQSRRIEKKVYVWDAQTVNWSLVTDHLFLYDGWNLIAELNASDLSLVRKYCWGLDLSGSLQGAGGVGGLLAVTSTTTTQFTAYDGNGNVVALIDAATGAKSARYEYDPFGNTLVQTGAAAAGNPFRFSTKYTDSETGLLYYGYRYYSPRLGRWTCRDPIQDPSTALLQVLTERHQVPQPHLYILVGNNAVSLIDALGLLTWNATLVYTETGTANPTTLAPVAAYAKNLLAKFGVDFEFTYHKVKDTEWVYTPIWVVPWWTSYEMKEISAPPIPTGKKSIDYLAGTLGISDPILFPDFWMYGPAGWTYPKGIIVYYGSPTLNQTEKSLLIVHELLAHYHGHYNHEWANNPAWVGWERLITHHDMEKWEEKISCQVADWIRKQGGNPDAHYVEP